MLKKTIFIFSLLCLAVTFTQPSGAASNFLLERTFDVPEFQLDNFDGKLEGFTDQNLKNGEVNILVFFASWCPFCRKEHPVLVELKEKHNLNLYAIALKNRKKKLNKFLGENGNPFLNIGMDLKGHVARQWNIRQIPTMFIIGKSGKVRYVHYGNTTTASFEQYVLPKLQDLMNE